MEVPLAEWSVTEGLVTMAPAAAKALVEAGKVAAALQLREGIRTARCIFLFKDLGPHCKDPQMVRALRDLYFSPDSRLWTLVLLDAVGLPPEVRRLTVPFDVGWPGRRGTAGDRPQHLSRRPAAQPARRSNRS